MEGVFNVDVALNLWGDLRVRVEIVKLKLFPMLKQTNLNSNVSWSKTSTKESSTVTKKSYIKLYKTHKCNNHHHPGSNWRLPNPPSGFPPIHPLPTSLKPLMFLLRSSADISRPFTMNMLKLVHDNTDVYILLYTYADIYIYLSIYLSIYIYTVYGYGYMDT